MRFASEAEICAADLYLAGFAYVLFFCYTFTSLSLSSRTGSRIKLFSCFFDEGGQFLFFPYSSILEDAFFGNGVFEYALHAVRVKSRPGRSLNKKAS